MQQVASIAAEAGWLTLIESAAAEEGTLAASACESMRRALMSLDKAK